MITNTNAAPEDTTLAALVDSAAHAHGLAHDSPGHNDPGVGATNITTTAAAATPNSAAQTTYPVTASIQDGNIHGDFL